MSAAFKPRRLSVIIAAYNGVREIDGVLDNVGAQREADIELIVIDGGSTDGTVDRLRARNVDLGFWLSESDAGIYDAWNKGVARATGEWVLFLGVDDRFATDNSAAALLRGSEHAPPGSNLIVAQGRLLHRDGTSSSPYGHYSSAAIKRHSPMMTSATMIHRSLIELHAPFALDLPIAGDYDFFLRAVEDTVAHNIREVTCLFGDAGVSSQVFPALRDTRRAQARSPHVGPLRANAYFAVHVAMIPAGAVHRRIKRWRTTHF